MDAIAKLGIAYWTVLVLSCLGILQAVIQTNAEEVETADAYPYPCDMTPEQHTAIRKDAVSYLTEAGFTVEEGKMEYRHATAFLANPSSYYGEFLFGTAEISPFWTLSEQDAIVFFGCTPPRMRYFSYTPYVFTNPPVQRDILFASLDDALNLLEINTTGVGLPFSHTTLLILTPDELTNARVKVAFERAHLPREAMNTMVIPHKLVTLGDEVLSSSILSQLGRIALCEDETVCQAYLNSSWPVYQLRFSSGTKRLYETPEKRKRGSGHSEVPYYTDMLTMLVEAVEKNFTSRGFQLASKGQMEAVPLDGRECITMKKDCLADCSDAAYMALADEVTFGPADSKDFYIVVGVNHARTGKAVYTNFALSSFEGVTDDKFGNSSRQYISGEPGISSYFAYKVARQCQGEQYCLTVPIAKVGEGTQVRFTARAYLDPKTRTGPAYDELVMDYVLHFQPSQ